MAAPPIYLALMVQPGTVLPHASYPTHDEVRAPVPITAAATDLADPSTPTSQHAYNQARQLLSDTLPRLVAEQSNEETRAELETKKLQQEIRQLEISNARELTGRARLLDLAPFLTALLTALGVLIAWSADRKAQRAKAAEDLRLRAEAAETQISEQFSFAAAHLAADNPRLRIAGAAAIARLQAHAKPAFQRILLAFLVLQLREDSSDGIRPVLVDTAGRALDALARTVEEHASVDLSDAHFIGLRLHGTPLSRIVRYAHRARIVSSDLMGADLKNVRADSLEVTDSKCEKTNFAFAVLRGLHATRTNFNGAGFASADLKNSVIADCSFRGARLQSAHFEGSTLTRVDFSFANIDDCYLVGATMDEFTQRSLGHAMNRGKAHS